MAQEAYIFDAIRTPRGRGKKDGSLHEVTPTKLAAQLYQALSHKQALDTKLVDTTILGCVTPIFEQGGDIAKAAVYMAGWDQTVPGFQLNCFCASGLVAVNTAAMRVKSGFEDCVVAGGVESMSRVPMGMDVGAMFYDPEVVTEMKFVPQGIGADLIATIDCFNRDDVDQYALRSQQLAHQAWQNGYFNNSVIPVKDDLGLTILEKDEYIRPDTTLDALHKLPPSFAKIGAMGYDNFALSKYLEVETINHVHTPGNSSGIVDGCALVLVSNEQFQKVTGKTPRARIVATALTSCDPTIMLTAPTEATKKVLKRAQMTIDNIDLFEVNEAFASVVLRFMKHMEVPLEKVNVNGGAIAMGHPLGATGAMLLGSLLDELERQQKRFGLATLCVGGGMGVATIIERLG